MKKTIAIIALALLVTSCGTAQIDFKNPYTDEVLDGIFDIRLGMSINDLKAVVDTTFLKEYEVQDREWWYGEEISKARSKYLRLEQYTPGRKLTLLNIDLSFFDNELYNIIIFSNNADLEDMLTNKYGKQKRKNRYTSKSWYTNSEDIRCSFSGGFFHLESDATRKKVLEERRAYKDKKEQERRKKMKSEREEIEKDKESLLEKL